MYINPENLFHAWIVMLGEDDMDFEVEKKQCRLLSPEEIVIKNDLFDKLSNEAKKVVMIIVLDLEGTNKKLSIDNEYEIYIKKRLNGLRYRLQKNNPPNVIEGKWHDIWYSLDLIKRNEIISRWEKDGINIPKQLKIKKKVETKIPTAFDSTCGYNYLKKFLRSLLNMSEYKINKVFRELKAFVDEIYL